MEQNNKIKNRNFEDKYINHKQNYDKLKNICNKFFLYIANKEKRKEIRYKLKLELLDYLRNFTVTYIDVICELEGTLANLIPSDKKKMKLFDIFNHMIYHHYNIFEGIDISKFKDYFINIKRLRNFLCHIENNKNNIVSHDMTEIIELIMNNDFYKNKEHNKLHIENLYLFIKRTEIYLNMFVNFIMKFCYTSEIFYIFKYIFFFDELYLKLNGKNDTKIYTYWVNKHRIIDFTVLQHIKIEDLKNNCLFANIPTKNITNENSKLNYLHYKNILKDLNYKIEIDCSNLNYIKYNNKIIDTINITNNEMIIFFNNYIYYKKFGHDNKIYNQLILYIHFYTKPFQNKAIKQKKQTKKKIINNIEQIKQNREEDNVFIDNNIEQIKRTKKSRNNGIEQIKQNREEDNLKIFNW